MVFFSGLRCMYYEGRRDPIKHTERHLRNSDGFMVWIFFNGFGLNGLMVLV